jgi:Glycosyltransferase Family 4
MAAAEAVTYDFYQSDLFVPTWSGWESLAASNVKQQTDGSSCTSCQGGKMRIAIIAHLKYPISEPFAGGLEMHTHMLARSLRERGHDVTLFASTRSDPALGVEAICDETSLLETGIDEANDVAFFRECPASAPMAQI